MTTYKTLFKSMVPSETCYHNKYYQKIDIEFNFKHNRHGYRETKALLKNAFRALQISYDYRITLQHNYYTYYTMTVFFNDTGIIDVIRNNISRTIEILFGPIHMPVIVFDQYLYATNNKHRNVIDSHELIPVETLPHGFKYRITFEKTSETKPNDVKLFLNKIDKTDNGWICDLYGNNCIVFTNNRDHALPLKMKFKNLKIREMVVVTFD